MGKLINILKGNLKWIILGFFIVYFLSMFVYPLYINFSYSYLMQTWLKWQSFNVGVLAFLSTYYFYLGTKKREEIQRFEINQREEIQRFEIKEREKSHRRSHYLANASIITHEFALINNYLRKNIKWLDEQWDSIESVDNQAISKTEKPKITETYLENFKNCMLYSEHEEREYLSSLLFKLQMFKSRLDKTQSNIVGKEFSEAKFRIISCIYNSIEIYSHILTNYNYYRQSKTFNSNVFDIDVFDDAINQLDLKFEKYQHHCFNLDHLRSKYAIKGESELLSKK